MYRQVLHCCESRLSEDNIQQCWGHLVLQSREFFQIVSVKVINNSDIYKIVIRLYILVIGLESFIYFLDEGCLMSK